MFARNFTFWHNIFRYSQNTVQRSEADKVNFANKMQIIQKIVQSEQLVTAYCAASNMPLIDCSNETFNDRAFAFENEELMKTFIKPWLDRRVPVRGLIFLKKDRMKFFATLASINVDELVYVDKSGVYTIKLPDIIKKQDMSKLPPQARPVENPQLQMSGIYFIQEASRGVPQEEKTKLPELEEEFSANVVKGIYLMPVNIIGKPKEAAAPGTAAGSDAAPGSGAAKGPDAAPGSDAAKGPDAAPGSDAAKGPDAAPGAAGMPGGIRPGQQLQFKIPLLKDQKGNTLQPIFTDNTELSKFSGKGQIQVMKVPFAGLEKLLAKEASAYILNPGGFHLNITRQQLTGLQARFGTAPAAQSEPVVQSAPSSQSPQ